LTIALSFLAAAYFFRLALDPAKESLEKKDFYWLFILALGPDLQHTEGEAPVPA